MLDTFREHSKGWLAKLILAFITIPFALWGIDSYLQGAGSNVAVATVDGKDITVQEFAGAMEDMRNQLQASGKNDPALLEDPATKQSVLNRLILKRLLDQEVRKANFKISDEVLSKYVMSLPEFHQDGKFSQELYDAILAQNNLTPTKFEARMRAELLSQVVRESIASAAVVPQSVADQILKAEHQRREVTVTDVNANDFVAQTKVDDAQVKAYYEKNKDKFRVPEQVKIEFAILSANNFIPAMSVDEEEVKKYYAENAAKFQGDEQRRASHILISFGGKTDEASKKAARDKAAAILAEVMKDPKKFADLARKNSQDPGSAEKGGDLGLFGRGMMVKPFEEAVYAMSPGAISDLVESEFGYHIIQLTEIKGQGQSLDEVKENIRAELLYQGAGQVCRAGGKLQQHGVRAVGQQPVAKTFGTRHKPVPDVRRTLGFFKPATSWSARFSAKSIREAQYRGGRSANTPSQHGCWSTNGTA